jgi:hypothetical protein
MSNKKSASGAPSEITGTIAAFDAASCAAASVTVQSVPIPQCLPGDIITVIPAGALANLLFGSGRCAVAGTALIPVCNPTAAPIDPAVAAYLFAITRP